MSATHAVVDAPLLEMRGIGKSFPGVRALRDVDLTLDAGEVLALLGENGAGKSTLIKVLAGAHPPDCGSIRMRGAAVRFDHPAAATQAGIAVIYQEFNLIPDLTVWENIFLGHEQSRWIVHRNAERRKAIELFERIGATIPVDALCRDLTIAQQQIVEIAKALSEDAQLIVMDEPSATISPREVERLFDIVRDLQSQHIGVIYISHRLDEIFSIADRVTVLRDGEAVGEAAVSELSRTRLIEMMVGREIEKEFPKHYHTIGAPRLEVCGLTRGTAVRGSSFNVHRGEVLGLTGLVGSGRTETARLIFGADKAEAGHVKLDGKTLRIRKPSDAIRAGICLLTEDRKHQGLVLNLSIRENFALPNLDRLSTFGIVNRSQERTALAGFIDSLQIKVPHQEQPAGHLSGGNQQKVVLAKWLMLNAEVIIFDEPTRGIDVGAKYEIYQLMNQLAEQGKAILMISSELPEILGMSDRILVMHDGRITGEISDAASATQEQIMQMAVG
jgi:ribose transport system ATP-binding protein